MTFGRGGHGRTPGGTDPRQGTARGETYLAQATSGIKAVLLIALFIALLAVSVAFMFDPDLRPWGLGALAVLIVAIVWWSWRERANRPSLDETLSNLGED